MKSAFAAICLCIMSSLFSMGQAQTLACPEPGDSIGHWYSPIAANRADHTPLQCATCQDPANRPASSCIVYRILQSEDCARGYCTNEQGEIKLDQTRGVALQRSLRHEHPVKFWFDAANNCWFILWATQPAIGAEHVAGRQQQPYWQYAFEAASSQIVPPIAESEVALLMHAANRRSQHQLHIHIGRLTPAYRQALEQAEKIDQPAQAAKSLPLAPQAVTMTIDGVRVKARLVADEPGKAPLENIDIFNLVQAVLPNGAADMPHYTIMLARATQTKGTWILVSQDLSRRVMNLSQPRTCRFASR